MFAVGIPFIIISSIVVGLRVHVRLNLLKMKLAWDDCKSNPGGREYAFETDDGVLVLMITGTIFTIALSVANMICKGLFTMRTSTASKRY